LHLPVLRDFLFAHAQKLKLKKGDGIKKKGEKSREGEIYLVKPFLDGTTPKLHAVSCNPLALTYTEPPTEDTAMKDLS